MPGPLTLVFWEGHEPSADLEPVLEALVGRARAAWPTLALTPEAFVRALARHVLPDDAPSALESLHAEDLYLATACLHGDAQASAELDRRIRSGPLPKVARQLANRVSAADVHGRLLQRLLMAEPGKQPKLAEYAGRGPLDGWLQVVAFRVALNLAPPDARAVPLDEQLLRDDGPATGHPELDLLRERFRADFRAAVRKAVASLSARDRTLLQLSVMEGVGIDALSRTFQVHRATVARWIVAAREQIVQGTREALRQHLALKPAELDSLMGLADSQLEVSLGRLLRDEDA